MIVRCLPLNLRIRKRELCWLSTAPALLTKQQCWPVRCCYVSGTFCLGRRIVVNRAITPKAVEDAVQSHTWRCVPSSVPCWETSCWTVPCLEMLVERVGGTCSAGGSYCPPTLGSLALFYAKEIYWLSALLRVPNDFILMGHESAQGNRWLMKWDANGSDEFIYLTWVSNLLLGRRWLTLTSIMQNIHRNLCS